MKNWKRKKNEENGNKIRVWDHTGDRATVIVRKDPKKSRKNNYYVAVIAKRNGKRIGGGRIKKRTYTPGESIEIAKRWMKNHSLEKEEKRNDVLTL